MVNNKVLFDLDDILIQPTTNTKINSRGEVSTVDDINMLPLFAAPMDTVVDESNYKLFNDVGIYTIIPRKPHDFYTKDYISFDRRRWFAYGLSDFKLCFIDNIQKPKSIFEKMYALIDIANGHMELLLELVEEAKSFYGDHLVLMVGNVANPQTYVNLSNAGADYIRCGVGNGGGCLTSQNTGIGYPMGSLIKEIYEASLGLINPAHIVADGGIKSYSDIIKCLALGSDYVMVGSIFNKAFESVGENYIYDPTSGYSKVSSHPHNEITMSAFKNKTLFKEFRGMSTKEVQNSLKRTSINTSEGVVKYQQVEYTIRGWVENFKHYLKTAMSYTNSFYLYDFIGMVDINLITNNAYRRFNK